LRFNLCGGERLTTETEKIKFHPNWMRVMYALTVIVAGVFGLAFLIAPSATESLWGIPTQEPIIAGIAYSMWFAMGIISLGGLRSPLKFTPVLVAEMFYKTVWIIAIIIPRAIAGTLPSFALTLAVSYLIPIIGNTIVIPWRYFFAK
jgi:hypothetical protein